jgi:hypothetical protein
MTPRTQPQLALRGIGRSAATSAAVTNDAVTRGIDRFAVTRDVRGLRPMGIVADLSNVYRRTLQGCYPFCQ